MMWFSFFKHVRKMPGLFISWLSRPFPCPETVLDRIKTSLIITLLVFVVLFVLQPFGLRRMEDGVIWLISGYSFITLFVMLFTSLALPLIFHQFCDPDKWTIGKYLIHILIDYLTISIFSWILTTTAGHKFIEAPTFLSFLLLTFSVGFFPVVSIVYAYERILFRKKLKNALFFSDQLDILNKKTTAGGLFLTLKTGSKSPAISFHTNDFLCATSNGNYSMVYYRVKDEIRHSLIRVSISSLERETSCDSAIVRCHRQALINMAHIEKFGGNARNYYLIVKGTNLRIEISRNIPETLLARLRNL